MTFFHPGHGEALKREAHRVMKWGAIAFACYNAGAWLARRQSHSAINAVAYTLLAALEDAHVRQHAEQLDRRESAAA